MIYFGCYFSISFTGLSISNQPLNAGDPKALSCSYFFFFTSFPWEESGISFSINYNYLGISKTQGMEVK